MMKMILIRTIKKRRKIKNPRKKKLFMSQKIIKLKKKIKRKNQIMTMTGRLVQVVMKLILIILTLLKKIKKNV